MAGDRAGLCAGFCVWATLADCRGRGSGISGITFGSSVAFGADALAMTSASCAWLALSCSVSVWLSRAIWIWVALIWSMVLWCRAISSLLALSWLARFSLSRTNCSCLISSCSTVCLKAAKSCAIGWNCCANSEDRETAVGATSFGRACTRGAGCEGYPSELGRGQRLTDSTA